MDEQLIDSKILPLVRALNIDGVSSTLGSCQGHLQFFRVRGPYVYFKASTQFAALLNREIYAELCTNRPSLNYPWHLYGMFNESGELCFRLAVPDFDHYPWVSFLAWSRQRLDSDFSGLRKLAQIAGTKMGNNPIPNVKRQSSSKDQWKNAQQKEIANLPAKSFLLSAQLACRIGSAAFWAFIGRRADRVFTFSALNQRHGVFSSRANNGFNHKCDDHLIYTCLHVFSINGGR